MIIENENRLGKMMTINEKINHIRRLMEQDNIHAVIIPSGDPHKSEYVAEHWQARQWLTGFSGSAGIAVLTRDRAILWTDSRYYIQAEEQIQSSEFELFKMGEPDVPVCEKWLADNLTPGETIAVDGALFSMALIEKYQKLFKGKNLNLETGKDFISMLWEDRPPLPDSKAYLFSEKYAGQSRADKINRIREKMTSLDADYHLMVSLDDIAWLLNLRGSDVHTNPVNIAYILIGSEKAELFIQKQKIESDIEKILEKDGVGIRPYADINIALSEIPENKKILLDPDKTSIKLKQSINQACGIIKKQSPCVAMKAVKNDIQIGHIKDTAVHDGVSMVNFLYWLEHQESDLKLTEMSVADKLFSLRKVHPDFIDNSFDPIMAYKEHSAMCHYSATQETDAVIGNQGLFLTDSGGNYLTGTTDITRTISRGVPTKQEIQDYTLVLKGHIAVASTFFPKNTRGIQIDTLARQFLWKQGWNFGHGTGHGVGFFLCVHEGPASISTQPVDEVLKPGMLLTNEPGIYREGLYGIRLENMVLVREAFENEFGEFFKFKQMTFCHFEHDLIDPDMLDEEEKNWINDYHKKVYDKISPGLENQAASWLKGKTRKL